MGKSGTASVELDRLVSHDSATAAAAETDGHTTAVVMAIWHITLPTSPTPNTEETKQSSPKGLLLQVPLRLPFFVVSSGQAGGFAFFFSFFFFYFFLSHSFFFFAFSFLIFFFLLLFLICLSYNPADSTFVLVSWLLFVYQIFKIELIIHNHVE